jgi:uncharacterized protein (DUF302 family)
MSENGLITIRSQSSVKATIDRLEASLGESGVSIFARIDHRAGAISAGMSLRPTEVLIFGNPKAGTPLIQAKPTIGIDLPLKVLAWEDATGDVWVTYNNPAWLAARHALGDERRGGRQRLGPRVGEICRDSGGELNPG